MDRHPTPSVDEWLSNLAWMRGLAQRCAPVGLDADDLAQEAILRALSKPSPEDLSGPRLRAWLARAVEGLALDWRRATRRRQAREQAVARAEAVGDDVTEGAVLSLRLQALASGLLALDEPYRTAILLHYGEGLDTATVAVRTAASPAAVRQRLTRGRQQLRRYISRSLAEHTGPDRMGGYGMFAALSFLNPFRPLASSYAALGIMKTWMIVGGAGALMVGAGVWTQRGQRAIGYLDVSLAAVETSESDFAPLDPVPLMTEALAALEDAPLNAKREPSVTEAPQAVTERPVGEAGAWLDSATPAFAEAHAPQADPASCVGCHRTDGEFEVPAEWPDGWTEERGENGNVIAEGVIELGRREGLWREFFEDGELRRSLTYQGGIEHGPLREYESGGTRIANGSYSHGARHGGWKEWHPNGEQSRSAVYVGGRLDGLEIRWWPNGQRSRETHWIHGLRHGLERDWHENGQLAIEQRFARGAVEGEARRWDSEGNQR